MLPLGPTHSDGSPYQCLSVHAGNPLLISLEWLIDKGWLDLEEITVDKGSKQFRLKCLNEAHKLYLKEKDKMANKKILIVR